MQTHSQEPEKNESKKMCIKICTKNPFTFTHKETNKKILPFVFNYVLREQNANNDNEFLKNPALYYQKKREKKHQKNEHTFDKLNKKTHLKMQNKKKKTKSN